MIKLKILKKDDKDHQPDSHRGLEAETQTTQVTVENNFRGTSFTALSVCCQKNENKNAETENQTCRLRVASVIDSSVGGLLRGVAS